MLKPAIRNCRRLEMPLSELGVREIPVLGRYNFVRAQPPLPEHTHGNILEVCFLVKGRQTYRVGARNYHLRGGDVFVAFPHEHHGSAANPQEKGVLYWIMLQKAGPRLFGLTTDQSAQLWKSLCQLPVRHFRGSAKMMAHLDALTEIYLQKPSALRPAFLTAEALGFFLDLLRCATSGATPARALSRMDKVCRHIRDNLESSLAVPQLAAHAGLSVPRFKASFKEATGTPPGEYILRAKVDEAGRRLALGRFSVTEIAFALNFSSSQYFATVFKRFTGMTPSAAAEKFRLGRESKKVMFPA